MPLITDNEPLTNPALIQFLQGAGFGLSTIVTVAHRLEGVAVGPAPGLAAHDAVLREFHIDARRDELAAAKPHVAHRHPAQRLRRHRLQPHRLLPDTILISTNITRFQCQKRQGASCSNAADSGCQIPARRWTRQVQARRSQPWARCTVFIPLPASRGL